MSFNKHLIFLRRCFDLARLGNGKTSPNPSVGALIVTKYKIIGEGWHHEYGEAHAEVNAVADIKSKNIPYMEESTIFVSLEPCFHFGKTPPCVELILKEKIPHVVIAFSDPNPNVAGQSVEKLRKNNVSVQLMQEISTKIRYGYENTLKSFIISISKQRPFIILKWAESTDGYIGKQNERIQISNELSKRLVHKWRSECDAILIGTQTAETDNPALNNRFYFGKSPVRIVLDKNGRLSHSLQIFDETIKTILYTESSTPTDTNNEKNLKNIDFRQIKFDKSLIYNLLQDLHTQKIGILLVEGGAKTLQSFIESGLWDEARIIKSPVLLRGGILAPTLPIQNLESHFPLDDNEVLIYKNH